MQEKIYDTIEQYINGELQGEDLQNFEQAMKNDPNLAKEVALHQKLHRQLGDPAKIKLSRVLENLRSEFSKEEKATGGAQMFTLRSIRPALAIAASILLLVTIGYFFWKNMNLNEARMVEENKKPTIDTIQKQKEDLQPLPEEETQLANEEEIRQEEESQEPLKPKQKKTIPEKPKFDKAPDYLAEVDPANFTPNSYLHPRADKNVRGCMGFIFDVKAPDAFSWSAKNTKITIEGTVKARNFPKGVIMIQLFSNKVEDYKKGNTILEEMIDFSDPSKANPNTFPFKFSTSLDLKPGLYYYIIKNKKRMEDDCKVGKFEVNNKN